MHSSIYVSRNILACFLVAACVRSNARQRQPAEPAPPSKNVQPASAALPSTSKAALDEVTYRGTGTEPFWGLSVTARELKVTWPEPEPSIATPYTIDEGAAGRTYQGKALNATVTFKSCSDGMSDRIYPDTLQIQIGARVLHGCGWPASYDLGRAP